MIYRSNQLDLRFEVFINVEFNVEDTFDQLGGGCKVKVIVVSGQFRLNAFKLKPTSHSFQRSGGRANQVGDLIYRPVFTVLYGLGRGYLFHQRLYSMSFDPREGI